jgi:hypothetical protein
MIGWLIIAVAVVLGWSLKGGGIGGYSVVDQSDVARAQMEMRLSQRLEERL